jgi:hypothetical protein
MLEIKKANYAGDYCLDIVFNNGKSANVDLKESIFNDKRPVFKKLKNLDDFKSFKLDHHTVVWFEELDLAPEYLFYLAFKDDENLQKQFKEWGYIT